MELPNIKPELQFKTSRSSGAGGQHVNKVETKVEVRFDIKNSELISEKLKSTLLNRLEAKVSGEGVLIVISQASRSQLKNKELAIKKILKVLRRALHEPKVRKPTTPHRSAVESRLSTKKNHAQKKAWRSKPDY